MTWPQKDISERINEIKLVLQKPLYIFSVLDGGDIMLILEDAKDNINLKSRNGRKGFRGRTILGAVETAEKYIEQERKMGSLMVKIPKAIPKDEEKKDKEYTKIKKKKTRKKK